MQIPDYYRILGVSPSAGDEEIRKAYRKKAKTLHPDIQHTGGEEAFQRINEAYQILMDPEQRRKYDLKIRYSEWYDTEITRQSKKYGTHRHYQRTTASRPEPAAEHRGTGLSGRNLRLFNRILFISIVVIVSAGILFGLIDLLFNGAYLGILFFLVIFFILLAGKRFLDLGKKTE